MLNGKQNLNQIFLGVGTNLGNRLLNFQNLIELLQENKITVVRTANIYESIPVGFISDDLFYNSVFEIDTSMNPFELLDITQAIELKMGRIKTPNQAYSSRIIDIDILLFGHEVINTSKLQIPHKYILDRKFVFLPLKELINSELSSFLNEVNGTISKAYIDENEPIIVHYPLLVS